MYARKYTHKYTHKYARKYACKYAPKFATKYARKYACKCASKQAHTLRSHQPEGTGFPVCPRALLANQISVFPFLGAEGELNPLVNCAQGEHHRKTTG